MTSFIPDVTTGTLCPSPWFYALDDVGVTLPGALANFYAAGTGTTPRIDTFSDVLLTTPNANPVVADSAGRLGPIYLTPGLSYKLILTTSLGVLIRTLDNIPATPGLATTPPIDNTAGDYRLTLTAGVPVTVSDVLAATSLHIEPYAGDRLGLYSGSTWNLRTVSAGSLVIPNVASTCYDVFAYDNAGTIAYEVLAWTTDTTRATAITFQDGVPVQTGVLTRRYLGTVRTTAVAGQTEDSRAKRYLWNYSRRIARLMLRQEATSSWTYTTNTLRQANAAAANQLDFVLGLNEDVVTAHVWAAAANSTAGVLLTVGIGVDSTTALTAEQSSGIGHSAVANDVLPLHASYIGHPGVGRRTLVWLEQSAATGTTTWNGTLAGGPSSIVGIVIG